MELGTELLLGAFLLAALGAIFLNWKYGNKN